MFDRISRLAAAILLSAPLATLLPAGQDDAKTPEEAKAVPPIVDVDEIPPGVVAFEKSSATEPLELRSVEEAAEVFSKQELAKLTREVDFEEQIVLVFAWKGSGRDRLTFDVAESNPEQVTFTYTRGRTRDLRPHVEVLALRRNVEWSVKRRATE